MELNQKLYEKIKALVDEATKSSIEIRHQIHSCPELSGQEIETSKLIQGELDKLNIAYDNHVFGHGVSAIIDGHDKTKAIGIRADIDALPLDEQVDVPYKSKNPGVMHACGHDIHTSVLLGTAKVLNALKSDLPYSVRLIFEPAEETTGGAKQMIDAGCLDNPKVTDVVGLHIEPNIDAGKVEFIPGSMNAASTEFTVTVHGKSCHGAHPYKGIDPLVPACNMVTSLQSIITRRLHPADAALITVGVFNSGMKSNIIPNETTFSGIIRVLDMEKRDFIKSELARLCKGIAESAGATCDVSFRDSYPVLINNSSLLTVAKAACEQAIGAENVLVNPRASLGADDFAYFCHDGRRAIYYNIGCHKPGDPKEYALHNSELNPDEDCIKVGIITEVVSVLSIMGETVK
ncbi:MAG TPA: M20 family metallopeptidase [Anaerovoracaceae bacterium]|nr:M20 family metallopeptidase [Anaerovoracaceae bacterium]